MLLTSYGAYDLGWLVWGNTRERAEGRTVVLLGAGEPIDTVLTLLLTSRKGGPTSIDRKPCRRVENVFDRKLSIFVGS